MTFNGASTQTVSGASGVTLNGNGAVAAGSGVVVAGPFSVNDTLFVDGTLRVDPSSSFGGTGAYVYHPTSSTLVFNQSGTFTRRHRTALAVGGRSAQRHRAERDPAHFDAQCERARRAAARSTTPSGSRSAARCAATRAGRSSTRPSILDHRRSSTPPPPTSATSGADGSIVSGVPKHVTIDAGAGTVTMPAATRSCPAI